MSVDRRQFLLTGGAAVAATVLPDALQGADANDVGTRVDLIHQRERTESDE